uniref:Protein SRG1 n=1 Tax=Cajanus cajan TaxID=3821 RepID=A0A151SQW7_CAJCA|nr:Protein SRG1 [Cajanus cajan]
MEETIKNQSGTSLLVPSVQELAKQKLSTVPERYIQPQHEHMLVISEEDNRILEIPVIDMHNLLSLEFGSAELDKLHHACKEWGFFQIITNGIYRSIEHRATVSSEKERLSIATFYSPTQDGVVGPASSLITEQTPARFKSIGVKDYFKGLFSRKLDGKSYVDVMRI